MTKVEKPLVQIERLLKENKLDEATLATNQLIKDAPTRFAVLASIALKGGNSQKAEVLFQRALKQQPGHSLAAANYTKLLISQKKYKAAFPYAEQSYKENPSVESLALPYCQCLAELDRFGEAAAVIEPFLKKDKPSVAVMNAQISLLRADLRPQEALLVLNRAIELYPDEHVFKKSLADVYTELDPYEALKAFQDLAKTDDSIQAKWNRSFVKLRLGLFSEGWLDYEAGLDEKIGKIGRPLPAQIKGLRLITEFDEIDPQKWTIFSGEQGLGDQVLFLGALNEAIEKFPKSIYITEDRLIPIIKRSFPNIDCVSYAFGLNLIKQDHRVNGIFPIGSLQKHLRNKKDDFITYRKIPYLIPNSNMGEKFSTRLEQKLGKKRLVGISWRGGYWDRQVRTKSFELKLFENLMGDPDTVFLSLQYGDVSEERAYAKENSLPLHFVDGIDFKKDIDAWFTLASLCERVISVSTALVHFMGAIGKPVDLILGYRQGPFIWGLEEGPSLPYPTVTRHRQVENETPEQYFQRLAKVI